MKIFDGFADLVGRTPMMRARRLEASLGLKARLLLKLEYFNPAGSVKDRVAKAMVEDAEERGLLKPGAVIVEPTSGNTGIGLAAIAASKGYKIILTMPETMSAERRALLRAYGAQLVLTEGGKGMKGAIAKAERIAQETPGAFIPGQFTNMANPKAHYTTTGPEIWSDTDGQLDFFVAGIGTGGTVSGAGRYLKEQKPSIQIIGLEPEDSAVITQGKAGPHKIQGIGAGFVPDTLEVSVCDEVLRVPGDEAMAFGKKIADAEGILVGISSGAAVWAAVQLASNRQGRASIATTNSSIVPMYTKDPFLWSIAWAIRKTGLL